MTHWFKVRTAHFNAYRNEVQFNEAPVVGDSAEDAVARRLNELNRPIYCRLHDEMPEAQRSGPIGSIGMYTPRPSRAVAVQPMRESYANGGMCVYEDGPWTLLD